MTRRAVLTSYAGIREERVDWLWPGRVPLGAVTLLAGQPGLGKSQISLMLAARLTRGELPCGPARAIVVTGEDHRAAVIKPRLLALQADLDLGVLDLKLADGDSEDGLRLPDDVAELESCIAEEGARLVVIDPLVAFLDGSIDSWKDASVRQALAPLAGLAERQACSILGVVHVNKGLSGDAFQRIGGSVGFQGAPRSVLVLGRDPDNDDQRVLVHTKSNYGREAPGLLFTIEQVLVPCADGPDLETSRMVELGETDHDAEAVLGARGDSEERGKRDDAEDFLRGELAGGPLDVKTIQKLVEASKVASWRTIETAKAKLGIVSRRVGGAGADGRWTWELPNSETPRPQTPLLRGYGLSEDPHGDKETERVEVLTPQDESNGVLSVDGEADTPIQVTGLDGKSYPASLLTEAERIIEKYSSNGTRRMLSRSEIRHLVERDHDASVCGILVAELLPDRSGPAPQCSNCARRRPSAEWGDA